MVPPRARVILGLLLAALLVPTVAAVIEVPTGAPRPAAARAGPGLSTGIGPADDLYAVGVTVAPGAWSMFPGDSVDLTATPTGVPADCDVHASWFDWSFVGGSAGLGYLNLSVGSEVRLTAFPNASGTIAVEVTALLALVCSSGGSVDVQPTGATAVALLPPVAITGFSAAPSDPSPGTWTAVRWTVVGGVPPYTVVVDFGDGNSTERTQSAPGNGSVLHGYPLGVFAPSLSVVDGRGESRTGGLAAPVVCADALSVVLEPVGPAEAGRPWAVRAAIDGGLGHPTVQWTLNGSDVRGTSDGGVPVLSGTASAATTLDLGVTVSEPGAVATANLTLAVVPAPSLRVAALPGGAADLGEPALVNGTVGSGVGPFVLNWTVLPDGDQGTLVVPADGTFVFPIVPGSPGPLDLTVLATDAAGGSVERTVRLGSVGWAPSATLGGPTAPVEAGRPFGVELATSGGVGPYDWVLRMPPDLSGSAPAYGTSGGGPVDWTGTPTAAGNRTVTAWVIDALGAAASANLTVEVLPALRLTVAVDNGSPPGNVDVYARIRGGTPPYDLAAELGGSGASQLNLSGPGAYRLRLSGLPGGTGSLWVGVRDDADVSVATTANVSVAPGPPSLAGASPDPGASLPTAGWAGGIALAAGGGLGGWLVWRRRTRPAPDAPDRAAARGLSFVRRALDASEGLDVETLGWIAEAEGLRPAEWRAALERWERIGKIARSTSDDGVESIRWDPEGAAVGGEPDAAGDR